MTPRKDRSSEVLGFKSSFVGQYPSLQCVILQRRDQTNTQLPINAHKARHHHHPHHTCTTLAPSALSHVLSCSSPLCQLPVPFETEVVRGDMLLVRMDERSEPQDLPLSEWEAFERSEGAEAAANGGANGHEATEERTSKRQRRR